MTLVSVFGLALPALPAGGVAFAGGLAAAAVVMGMGGARRCASCSPVRPWRWR